MHKTILISAIMVVFAGNVLAQTPTPTKSSQIDDLKERLATKVAELRQTQRKAISGTVKAVSVSTVTVETKTSDVKIELTDDISVFQTLRGKRTKLTTENVETDDSVVVFGEYDSGLDLLRAKIIVIQDSLPMRIQGTVSEIDREAFTVTVKTSEEQSYLVDIEKTTGMFAYEKGVGVIKGGFSKVQLGNIIHLTGTVAPKEEDRISAARFLDVGNVTGATPTVTETENATDSAAAKTSGTPTPTVKATPKPTDTSAE